MVRIRLTRMGRIHRPFYRIGVFDSRSRRDGRALEYLGYYDPLGTTLGQNAAEGDAPVATGHPEGPIYRIDVEGARKWIERGAQPSETVSSFLRREGIELHGDEARKAAQKARDEKRAKSSKSRKKAKASS